MKPKLIPWGNSIYLDYHDNLKVICKEHSMPVDDSYYRRDIGITSLTCLDGPHEINIRGGLDTIRELISRKISSKKYQDADYFDIDGYLTPASKETQVKNKNGEYFVTAQIKSNEKGGDQIVIYAGKKGHTGKSQIFIDPENGKLTFDQNDINPKDIFTVIEATFRDGSKTTIDSRSSERTEI